MASNYISTDKLLYYHAGLKNIFAAKATTLAGYGITDAYTKTEVDGELDDKVDKVSGKGLSTNDYTTTEKNKLAGIASGAEVNVQSDWSVTSTTSDAFIKNKPTSISGYGITDAYTKTEVDTALSDKADSATTLAGYGITDAMTSSAISTALSGKADNATTLSGYGITNAYTKTETDSAIATAIGQVTQISFEVVQTLPASGTAGTIYLVPNSGSSPNSYDEYIWVSSSWEKIGTTDVDLSGYWAKADLTEATNAQIDTILAS